MFSYCKFLYFFSLKYFKIQKILPFCILYRKRRNGVCQIFIRYNEPDDFKTGFWYSGSESKFIITLKSESTVCPVDPRGRDQSAMSNALYTRPSLKKYCPWKTIVCIQPKTKLSEQMVKSNYHARNSSKTSPRNSKEEKSDDGKPDYRRRDSVLVMDIIGNSNRCKDRNENKRKS